MFNFLLLLLLIFFFFFFCSPSFLFSFFLVIKIVKIPMHERGHWMVLTLLATGVDVFYTDTFIIKHYVKNGGGGGGGGRAFKICFSQFNG